MASSSNGCVSWFYNWTRLCDTGMINTYSLPGGRGGPRSMNVFVVTYLSLQGGQYLLVLVDFFGAQFIAYVMAIAEIAAVCWIYGKLKEASNIQGER